MVFKREGEDSYLTKPLNKTQASNFISRFFWVILVVVFVFILLTVYYVFLLWYFQVGDLVYNKDTYEIGTIKGISFFNGGYLIILSSGIYENKPFWDIGSLNQVDNYNIISYARNLSLNTSALYFELRPNDNFNDYIISNTNDSNGANVKTLIYLSGFGNFEYDSKPGCNPDFVCTEWGVCHSEYTLSQIINNQPLSGVRYRYCKDNSGCFPDLIDSRECENKINITFRKKVWCNSEYVEALDDYGRILARLKSNNFKNYMDINLNILTNGYCPYCHDGKKNYDETGMDCGGSCLSCAEVKKYKSS
jgi:hypothetical protein